MKIKKARVFGETQGLNNSFEQIHFKPSEILSQEKQGVFEFSKTNAEEIKFIRVIECFDCHDHAELDGYRFALVPLCRCCRTEREVKITNNRFERRMKK